MLDARNNNRNVNHHFGSVLQDPKNVHPDVSARQVESWTVKEHLGRHRTNNERVENFGLQSLQSSKSGQGQGKMA